MTHTRKTVGIMKRQAMNIWSNASPAAYMPPDASAGHLSSCRCRSWSKVAATTKTAVYPKATNPDCARQEIDFTRVFYRPDGQGHTTASL
jgi:hypothetical protein